MIGISQPVDNDEIPDTKAIDEYPLNDAERAERFAAQFGDDLRFVQAWKRWLVWDGVRWRPDEDGEVYRKALEMPRLFMRDAAEIEDLAKRTRAANAAISAGNQPKIQSMVAIAQNLRPIAVSPATFDRDPMLLGISNGVIELQSGAFRPSRKEDYITKQAAVAYDGDAECPIWEKFISTVLGGDEELISFVQRAVGYCLTGHVSEQCLMFLYGTGQNGKSTFAECLQHLFADYSLKTATSLYTLDRSGREPEPAIARLVGRRFVTGSETEEGADLAESRVKDLTGGDTLTGRLLHCAAFNFPPTHKLWIYGNHRPNVRGNDHGIWRRIRLVPFRVQIPDKDKDPDLLKKLLAEMPGILNWAIEGCIRWQTGGLGTARVVEEATADYREEEDELGEFLKDECVCSGQTERKALYLRYKSWAEARGAKWVPKLTTFSKRIGERQGIVDGGKSGAKRFWNGISLKPFELHI